MSRLSLWRLAFLGSGVAMMIGGPRHPNPLPDQPFQDSIAAMLEHPDWVPSHVFILLGFALLLAGIVLWQRSAGLDGSDAGWVRLAMLAAAAAVIEMALHTAAVVDTQHLRAGEPTPILTAHLVLTAIVNPLIGIALAGLAVRGARLGRLGSWWITWMAVVGGASYGFAGVYVVLTHDQRVSPLFAVGAILIALWTLLVGMWPLPAARTERMQSSQPLGA